MCCVCVCILCCKHLGARILLFFVKFQINHPTHTYSCYPTVFQRFSANYYFYSNTTFTTLTGQIAQDICINLDANVKFKFMFLSRYGIYNKYTQMSQNYQMERLPKKKTQRKVYHWHTNITQNKKKIKRIHKHTRYLVFVLFYIIIVIPFFYMWYFYK